MEEIKETMENVIEKTTENAELVKEKAEEALETVAQMDASTIVKIGVVGGLVGAAAGTFVFKPIRDKIAGIPAWVKGLKAKSDESKIEKKAEAAQKKIEKLQKSIDEANALKEENKD